MACADVNLDGLGEILFRGVSAPAGVHVPAVGCSAVSADVNADAAEEYGILDTDNGMRVSIGDSHNDGRLDPHVTNIVGVSLDMGENRPKIAPALRKLGVTYPVFAAQDSIFPALFAGEEIFILLS